MLRYSQFRHEDVFCSALYEVINKEDSGVRADLLQDVHFPHHVILLVAFLQHQLEGMRLFGCFALTPEDNTILAPEKYRETKKNE